MWRFNKKLRLSIASPGNQNVILNKLSCQSNISPFLFLTNIQQSTSNLISFETASQLRTIFGQPFFLMNEFLLKKGEIFGQLIEKFMFDFMYL